MAKSSKQVADDWAVVRSAVARELMAIKSRYEGVRKEMQAEYRQALKNEGEGLSLGQFMRSGGAGLEDTFEAFIAGGAWRR